MLLFRGFDPARPGEYYWFTVGGGLDAGETAAEGGARELREETGLSVPPGELGPPIWHEATLFPFNNRWYRQEQDYFVVRVDAWEVEVGGQDEEERRSIDSHRWWTRAEVEAAMADDTAERIYPAELARLMRGLG